MQRRDDGRHQLQMAGDDAALRDKVAALLASLQADPANGIAQIIAAQKAALES